MHCFQFLSVLTIVQEEIENNACMLSWGVNEVYDGTMLSWRKVFSSKTSSCSLMFTH